MSWFDILKKRKKKKKKASPYKNPKLRAKVVARVKARSIGDGKGGNASGEWSGNKAMIAAREYKEEGGTYKATLKGKTKEQQSLSTWIDEDWGTQTEHRAKEKGKTPKKEKTRGRYMPRATYKKTSRGTLNYQDRKKRKGVKAGKRTTPTGRKFSQK